MATDKTPITPEMYSALQKPLPAKAVTKHPTKTYLSSIKAIYVIERLNEVFGVGMWKVQNEVVREDSKHIVVKSALTFENHIGYFESFGGNDNADLGDAYKGACTDALTKIGSYLGVAMEVYKGEGNTEKAEETKAAPKPATAMKAQPAAPVMQVQPEPANQATIDALLLNVEGYKGLYGAQDLVKVKSIITTLTADNEVDIAKKIAAGITERILKGRAGMPHAASKAQLDLIDKMLFSRVFTAEEKAAFNTASYEYDNIDAANRIDWLTVQMKERKGKAKAA